MRMPVAILAPLPRLIFRPSPITWIHTFLAFLLQRSELLCCVLSFVVCASLNLLLALLLLDLTYAERVRHLLGGLLITQVFRCSLRWKKCRRCHLYCCLVLPPNARSVALLAGLAASPSFPRLLGCESRLLGRPCLLDWHGCLCAIRATKTRPSIGA